MDKLEREAEIKQPEYTPPTDEELYTMCGVYIERLAQIMVDITPDLLEAVDEALKEFDAPPESDVMEYMAVRGIRYHHFLPGPGCQTELYRCDIAEPGVRGAHAWILADLLDHGTASLIVTEPAMRGEMVLTGDSNNYINKHAALSVRYRMYHLIDRMENGTPVF